MQHFELKLFKSIRGQSSVLSDERCTQFGASVLIASSALPPPSPAMQFQSRIFHPMCLSFKPGSPFKLSILELVQRLSIYLHATLHLQVVLKYCEKMLNCFEFDSIKQEYELEKSSLLTFISLRFYNKQQDKHNVEQLKI